MVVSPSRSTDHRDDRDFIEDDDPVAPSPPNFLRRIAWLYPDDGCWWVHVVVVVVVVVTTNRIRATMGLAKILNKTTTIESTTTTGTTPEPPAKLFTFGELEVATDHHPSGRVTWFWHVALVVRRRGTMYVWDPALEPRAPVEMDAWINMQFPRGRRYRTLCLVPRR